MSETKTGPSPEDVKAMLEDLLKEKSEPKHNVPNLNGEQEEKPEEKPETKPVRDEEKLALQADLHKARQNLKATRGEFDQIKKAFMSAFGVEDEPEDPKELVNKALSEVSSLRMQLAVRDAIPSGVDRAALMDSKAFQDMLSKVSDPDDIADKITSFVEDNPRFKASVPGVKDSIAGGSVKTEEKHSISDLLRMAARYKS